MSKNSLLTNIGELVTLAPLAEQKRVTNIQDVDLGRCKDAAWLAIADGKVAGYGRGAPEAPFEKFEPINLEGKLLLPGLVDAHTHPVFGGNRSQEFCRRLSGETYQSIAASGGGIKYTVKCTRETPDKVLVNFAAERFKKFLSHGVTTVEAKSGYGLTKKDELRLLQSIRAASEQTPQTIVSTCLALHALMPEYESVDAYVRYVNEELLPEVTKQGLATYADAFVENGYFSVEQTQPYIEKAKSLGLKIRVHADEFADAGASLAAARWGAASVDHAEHASKEAKEALAASQTVVIMLPGTSLYTKIPYAQAKGFREAGCPLALATDYNPGSCQLDNLAQIATLGALHCGLTAAETMAAVTYVPAFSLGLADRKGALAVGHDADFCVYPMTTMEDWVADFGRTLPEQVWIEGNRCED